MNPSTLNSWIDGSLTPLLTLLATWSVRWAVLILVLMTAIACRLLRTTATRSAAAHLILLTGLLLPFVPNFWGPVLFKMPTPTSEISQVDEPLTEPDLIVSEQTVAPTDVVQRDTQIVRNPVATSVRPRLRRQEPPIASAVPTVTIGYSRLVLLATGMLWIFGVVLLLLRLIGGYWWLSCLCRLAVPVTQTGEAELSDCRQSLQVSRTVQLKTHPRVDSPLLVGGKRPCILVPTCWDAINGESRRAILLHEMAHVRRWDDFSKWFEEIVRSLFFFHPLVHWLISRIDAEREELCDGAVIQQGIEPRALAGVLLDACRTFRATGQRLPRRLVLPFFRQRSVKDRIQALMEESAMLRGRLPLSRRGYAVLGSLLTGFAVLIAGFGIQAEEPAKTPSSDQAAAPAVLQEPGQELATPTFDLSKNADFTSLITDVSQMKQLQQDLPIDVKGFGKMSMETMASLIYSDMAEAPRGRLVDIQGKPLSPTGPARITAVITALSHEPNCFDWAGDSVLADSQGRFIVLGQLIRDADGQPQNPETAKNHESVLLLARLANGQTFETLAKYTPAKINDVHIPTHMNPKVPAPQDVAKDEIAGVVVDEKGEPLGGVDVDLYDGLDVVERKIKAVTDKQGQFRLKGLGEYIGEDGTTVIRFRKAGFSPERFLHHPVGTKGWVVALAGRTYLEGIVKDPDGNPVAGAKVKGRQGPKEISGGIIEELWTETVSDATGRYRLYLQPDRYELQIKAPGKGVSRIPPQTVFYGDQRTLNVDLQRGVNFKALVVDSVTGKPVPNVKLSHWQHPGVEGRSDENGQLTIGEMLPGSFEFEVHADGYARWWSEECKSEWARLNTKYDRRGMQGNFNGLDFDLKNDMPPVKIVVERAVKVTGRVVDPDGQPVAGATVDAALTGHESSLPGDTRYSVRTTADGKFTLSLPASHAARYNAMAHDGGYQEWRHWANAVANPVQTKPGDEIKDVELKLTRPATVRGKIVDANGQPLPGFEVTAESMEKMENRYYVPTTQSKADGTFELKFLRPGQHVIRARLDRVESMRTPNLIADDQNQPQIVPASERREVIMTRSRNVKPSEPVTLNPGETLNDVVLKAMPEERRAERTKGGVPVK